MRYSSRERKKRRKGERSFLAIAIIVCVLLGYSLYVSSAGKWIMENYVEPVFKQEEQIEKEETPKEEDKKQQNMSFSGTTVYAMQTGAFKEEDNAKEAAEKIIKGGGAAYIHHDELYRVLVFGSPSKEEAGNAKKALEAIAGVNSNEYAINIPDLNLKVTGDEKNLTTVDTAFKTYLSAMERMGKLSLEAEKNDVDKDSILSGKKEIKDSLSEIQKQLEPLAGKDDKIKQLNELYKDIISRLERVEDGDKVTVLADVKSAYIEMACKYSDFVKSVSMGQ